MSAEKSVRGLGLSRRIFRLFIVLFPAGFRNAYRNDILELFRDRYREEYRRAGMKGALVYLVRSTGELVVQGSRERWQERAERIASAVPSKKEKARSWLTGAFGQDVRYAFRNLRQSPSFTLVAVLTLAIGIGANSAIFSVVNGVLLQPLPYESPEDLAAIYTYWAPESGRDIPKYAVGSPEYFDYLNQNRSMESAAAISTELVTITAGEGDPEMVIGGYVSSSMFSVLRIPPLLGRTLVAEDDGAQPAPVFVLSYSLWQRRFAGDPHVIGKTLEVGLELEQVGNSGPIIGVMPEGFAFPTEDTELWTQLPLDPARAWRGGHWFHMIARLAPGVTFEQADAEMKTMMDSWAKVYPDHHVGHGLFMMPLLDDYVANIRPALVLLLGAVGFVLLIACANVANLLMARGEGRRREMAVRSALGAGRSRLVGQLLTESLILATLGGAAGLVLSYVGTNVLLALENESVPRLALVGLDARVLAFTLGVVLLTSLIFGLIPAFQTASLDLSRAFKIGNRSATASRERMIFRKLLIVAEMALAILLVIGAGLVIKSFRQLLEVDPGFRTDNLLTVRFSLPSTDYGSEQAVAFYSRLTKELQALPGVVNVAVASRPPLYIDRSNSRIHIEGRPDATPDEVGSRASAVMAGPGLFETLGIPLRRGRFLDETDRADTPLSVVIDEDMARMYWPGDDPIGDRFRFAQTDGPWHTIVGIAGNVRFDSLNQTCPTFYFSHPQTIAWGDFMARTASIIIRTNGDPRVFAGSVRETVRKLDPNLPIVRLLTMDEILASSVARPRFIMTLLGVFAAVALVLGAIGVYGVMSHGVAQRTNEIGIRVAMGAKGREVTGMVLRQGMGPAVAGVLIGLAASLGTARFLGGFLFNVSTTDPGIYIAVAIMMVAVGLLACCLPARRASRIDPIEALRYE